VTRTAFLAALLLAAFLLPACDDDGPFVPDVVNPTVRIVYPGDFDTLGPGPNEFKAIATDDRGVRYASFWLNGDFLGIGRHPKGDTYNIWWDVRHTGHVLLSLSCVVDDSADNTVSQTINVLIRR